MNLPEFVDEEEDAEDEEWDDFDAESAETTEEADDWPDYDGLGDEKALEAQDEDDDDDVDIDELCETLTENPTRYPFFDGFVKSAVGWLEDEETTENLQAATEQLDRDLRSHFKVQVPDWLDQSVADLKQAFEKDDGENMLLILLHIQKVLRPS